MSAAAMACAEAGLDLLRRGHDEAAARLLDRAVDLGDDRLGTRLNAAVASGPSRLASFASQHPDLDSPLILLAQRLRADGDWAGAEAAYRAALAINPSALAALTALGAHLALSAPAQARPLLERASADPDAGWEVWHALGVACLGDGAPQAALAAFSQAHDLAPGRLDTLLLRGEAAAAAGDADELRRLGEADPLDVVVMIARAAVLEREQRRDDAIGELEAAVEFAPACAPALAALGGLLARAARPSPAALMLRRAIAVEATPQARLDLATVLIKQQRPAEARDLLSALQDELGPDETVACNLAVTECALGEQAAAVATAQRACTDYPGAFGPWRTLANTLPYSPDMTAVDVRAAMEQVSTRLERGAAIARTFQKRLKLGLLSGNLKTHPVAWLTIAGFENLDPARFELVCLGPRADDVFARRFAALATEWIDTSAIDDAELAAAARRSGVDIVIDLGGFGDLGRMAACARRLAPLQVKWVGMQSSTTGLPEMDWFITDRWETPPGFERFYTERLLTLPDGYVCYAAPSYAPDVSSLPADSNGFVTFGCFNNLAKITPSVVACWADLLRRAPRARLVVKNHQLCEAATAARFRVAFAQLGIDPARLDLRAASPHRELLAQYADIDIALDPFPYGGGLTTCEALWMGVPTVTMPGESFSARHTLSHQSNVGLAGWDAADHEGYVQLALRRSSDLGALAALRGALRSRMKASPLCDAPRFGRHLGQALDLAWQSS